MKQTTAMLYIVISTTLCAHPMQEPHQRKPQPQLMETTEQPQNPKALNEHKNTTTPVDRTIGCCIALSGPCLMFSLIAIVKLKQMIYGDL